MRRCVTWAVLVTIGLISSIGQAAPVSVKNLRTWHAPDHTRLVLDLSGEVEHKLDVLKNPDRISINLKNTTLAKPLPKLTDTGPLLAGVRTGQQDGNTLRVVLDLKAATRPRTYLLKPYGQYGYRLVVDLHHAQSATAAPEPEQSSRPVTTLTEPPHRTGPIVIAIDAGHGGDDPGAIGRRYRTYEKTVVLKIARELDRLVRKDPNMRSFMTRKGDYFVPLGRRVKLAEQARADIFVSIHADSLRRSKARGSSVYALSQRGATSAQARVLADRENASDLIGGVDLAETEDVLAKVLVDMSQTATISSSIDLGDELLHSMKKVGPIHIPRVGQAGFAVLKSYAIPSVLVETTFISHPGEERKLRSGSYQRKMARAIYDGLRNYIRKHDLRPRYRDSRVVAATPDRPKPKKAGRRIHVVKRGDTLSEIAQKYRVNMAAIRFANNLQGNKLLVGKRLIIPN